jgi:hypothetical protein
MENKNRYIAITRNVLDGVATIRAVSVDGSRVDNLNDVEISRIKAACREYGIPLYGENRNQEFQQLYMSQFTDV